MSYKEVDIGNAGTGIKYGSDDQLKIARLLNGVITGVGGPQIKTQDGFGFWDGVLYVRNQADNRSIIIRGPDNVPSTDLELELPPIEENDRLAAVGLGNAWNAAQQMEDGVIFKDQTEPATPDAGYIHLFVEGGHLKKKNSVGGIIDYDNIVVGIPSEYDDQSINIKNPAETFHYTIKTSAITANRKAILPVLTADDTFAFLGVENIFTNPQTIKKAGTQELLKLYRPNNSTNDLTYIGFRLNDSAGNDTQYGAIGANIVDPTDGTEDGNVFIYTRRNGSLSLAFIFGADGDIAFGTNSRVGMNDTNLTAFRNYTFPNVTTQLAGLAASNIFTAAQKLEANVSPLLTLYRTGTSFGPDIKFSAHNSSAAETEYGRIKVNSEIETAGAEYGNMEFQLTVNGVTQGVIGKFATDGSFECGSLNRRIKLIDTQLSAQRTFKFPNVDTRLAGISLQSGATVDINTTNAEQDLLNYSVAANQITANGRVKFLITGYLLQNQATGTTYTFAVKFGGTTMWADASQSVAQSATKLPFRIEGEIFNKNATNAQGLSGNLMVNDTVAATTGIGNVSGDEILINANFDSEGADTTKDTTTAQTLQVTVTMSVSNANVKTVVKNKEVVVIT